MSTKHRRSRTRSSQTRTQGRDSSTQGSSRESSSQPSRFSSVPGWATRQDAFEQPSHSDDASASADTGTDDSRDNSRDDGESTMAHIGEEPFDYSSTDGMDTTYSQQFGSPDADVRVPSLAVYGLQAQPVMTDGQTPHAVPVYSSDGNMFPDWIDDESNVGSNESTRRLGASQPSDNTEHRNRIFQYVPDSFVTFDMRLSREGLTMSMPGRQPRRGRTLTPEFHTGLRDGDAA